MSTPIIPLRDGVLSHVFVTVQDLKVAVEFYSTILGFSVCHFVDGKCAFLELPKSQGLRVALYVSSLTNDIVSPGRFLMIDVPDVDKTAGLLRHAGVFVSDVVEVPYGRAAQFRDPDGNTIEIHQQSS